MSHKNMLAVLIGGVNIVFSLVQHWRKSSFLKYCLSNGISDKVSCSGLAIGGAFIYVGTQMKGKERAQPLLIASLILTGLSSSADSGLPLLKNSSQVGYSLH